VKPQGIVAAGYDAMSERYAAWQSEIADDPRDGYVKRLLARLPERPDILEIGCGAGIEPSPTLARIGRLTGVDISGAQIDRARKALPDAKLIHGDVTTASFAEGSFDAIVALYMLTHVPVADLTVLLGRVATWLRPDGLLLATFGSGPRQEAVVDDWLGAPMFFSELDKETNERLVQEAGLRVIDSQLEVMHEPESEPGQGPVEVVFHWILARKVAES
jgi:cyclopropane fatty-acyl-phospholipid synthase-like methyltransferase